MNLCMFPLFSLCLGIGTFKCECHKYLLFIVFQFPDPAIVTEYLEPMVMGTIISPDRYLGDVMNLCLVSLS